MTQNHSSTLKEISNEILDRQFRAHVHTQHTECVGPEKFNPNLTISAYHIKDVKLFSKQAAV
jgi:hypothetical protein